VATATWGRQTQASIQWGDNQFRFLEVPEKKRLFLIFSQKICRPLKSAALGGRLVRLIVKPPLHATVVIKLNALDVLAFTIIFSSHVPK
jgi:hypothetical protein